MESARPTWVCCTFPPSPELPGFDSPARLARAIPPGSIQGDTMTDPIFIGYSFDGGNRINRHGPARYFVRLASGYTVWCFTFTAACGVAAQYGWRALLTNVQ